MPARWIIEADLIDYLSLKQNLSRQYLPITNEKREVTHITNGIGFLKDLRTADLQI